jgi:hypothetical protein
MAIRRGPMAVPEDADDVFAPYLLTANQSPMAVLGSPVDMTLHKYNINTSTQSVGLSSRLTAEKYMFTNNTNAEANSGLAVAASDAAVYDYQTGVGNGVSLGFGDDYTWMWKRAPKFFDVVCYAGDGTDFRNITHNLQAIPELSILKNRAISGSNWLVHHPLAGANSNGMQLNSTSGNNGSGPFKNAADALTDTTVSLGSSDGAAFGMNDSGSAYILYLFASLDGISKVGSYTGTGSTPQDIDCGFTNGARFVLIKKSSASGSWFVFDTERGIVSGNDPVIQLNNTDAQDSNYDMIDPYDAGFTVTNGGYDMNETGASYIFYAVA